MDTALPDNHINSKSQAGLFALSLGALGVVYGDIGTSPLYAVRECFHGQHAIALNPTNILGVLSLVFWSLTVVITVKYVGFIMKADNRGREVFLPYWPYYWGLRAGCPRESKTWL